MILVIKQLQVFNNTAGVAGYFGTRIVVNHNSSGIVTAFAPDYADLRRSFKVSLRTAAGSGKCQTTSSSLSRSQMKLIREEIESVDFIVESVGGKSQCLLKASFFKETFKTEMEECIL